MSAGATLRHLLLAAAVIGALGGAASGRDQPVMTYRLEPASFLEALPRLSDARVGLLEKLNRADRAHLARLPRLVVPERWSDDELAYSPLPHQFAAAAGTAKYLVVDLPGQMFGAYESGRLVRWGPISSGAAATVTPAGLYHLTWRAVSHVSTENPDWVLSWYFNFDNAEGRAFHQYELPGVPASHGCVRLLERDARWLFEWGDGWRVDARQVDVLQPGTPVLIAGAYRFGASPPWRSMAWLRQPVALPPSLPQG